jgi:hypothetical protein
VTTTAPSPSCALTSAATWATGWGIAFDVGGATFRAHRAVVTAPLFRTQLLGAAYKKGVRDCEFITCNRFRIRTVDGHFDPKLEYVIYTLSVQSRGIGEAELRVAAWVG